MPGVLGHHSPCLNLSGLCLPTESPGGHTAAGSKPPRAEVSPDSTHKAFGREGVWVPTWHLHPCVNRTPYLPCPPREA